MQKKVTIFNLHFLGGIFGGAFWGFLSLWSGPVTLNRYSFLKHFLKVINCSDLENISKAATFPHRGRKLSSLLQWKSGPASETGPYFRFTEDIKILPVNCPIHQRIVRLSKKVPQTGSAFVTIRCEVQQHREMPRVRLSSFKWSPPRKNVQTQGTRRVYICALCNSIHNPQTQRMWF